MKGKEKSPSPEAKNAWRVCFKSTSLAQEDEKDALVLGGSSGAGRAGRTAGMGAEAPTPLLCQVCSVES